MQSQILKSKVFITISFLILLFSQAALAAVEVVTPDGRRILLNDDYTWKYLSPNSSRQQADAGKPQAVLRVSHVDEFGGDACRLGIILENNLPYKIKSLSFRFTVYKSESLPYASVTRNYFEIKPTDHQYQKLYFRSISCSAIHHIKVEDPGRCSMGELDKFSALSGDCIEHVRVEPSQLINITK